MTTRIMMLTTAAGPDGVFMAGSVADVPDELAAAMIAAGSAEAVEATATAETATLPAAETATKAPQAPRRRTARKGN